MLSTGSLTHEATTEHAHTEAAPIGGCKGPAEGFGPRTRFGCECNPRPARPWGRRRGRGDRASGAKRGSGADCPRCAAGSVTAAAGAGLLEGGVEGRVGVPMGSLWRVAGPIPEGHGRAGSIFTGFLTLTASLLVLICFHGWVYFARDLNDVLP